MRIIHRARESAWQFFILIFLLWGSGVALAAGPHGVQFGQPLTDIGEVVLTDEVAQAIADTGAGFVRVNFRLGSYDADTPEWYAAYDGIVDRLRGRGLEIIALMTNEAWWGEPSRWKENSYEEVGGNGMNPYLENWVGAFTRMATHWQGKIKYWELWNEPDCLATIYPSNFGALLANAYDRARTNGLPVEIISGGVCGGSCTSLDYGPGFIRKMYDVSINKTSWFSQMKVKWGTYPLDHIGFHIYPNCGSYLDTSWLSCYLDCFHNAYAAFEGADTKKKMFLTEIGWTTNHNSPGDCYTTETIQASNITSAFNVANSKTYIQSVQYFFLQDVPPANLYFGVFDASGLGEPDKKPGWSSLNVQLSFEGRWSAGGSINQPILDYYTAHTHVQMGNPYDNGGTPLVHKWDFGPVQDFRGGQLGSLIVFDSADSLGYCVRGPFWETLLAGNNHMDLEFPLGDQFSTGTSEGQYFEGGYMIWDAMSGTQVSLYENKVPRDNSDSGFTASSKWSLLSASDAYKDGKYRRRAGTTSNTDPATWKVSIPKSGYYDVYARWPTISKAATVATYEIVHSAGTTAVNVNQAVRENRWNRLGRRSFYFNAGQATIRLSSKGSSKNYIAADALRLVGPVPESAP
jgi:hypothetical protein